MAKSNRQVYKIPQPKAPKAVQLEQSSAKPAPVGPERNGLCYSVFGGCMITGLILDAFLIYYLAHNAVVAYGEHPINWAQAILYTVLVGMALSLIRAVVWGSFILGAALAGRTQSFKAQLDICQWARKFHYVLPGGSSWATQAIIQRMITREEYKEAIALGSGEFEALAKKNARAIRVLLISAQVSPLPIRCKTSTTNQLSGMKKQSSPSKKFSNRSPSQAASRNMPARVWLRHCRFNTPRCWLVLVCHTLRCKTVSRLRSV